MTHTAHTHWLMHLYAAVRAKGCLNDTQSPLISKLLFFLLANAYEASSLGKKLTWYLAVKRNKN